MRLVLFIFAGRRANMEVQRPYLDRILTDYPQAELHLWDLTRTAEDARYLDSLEGAHGGRVRLLRGLHSGHPIKCRYPGQTRRPRGHAPCRCMIHRPPYEEPYKWYAGHSEYADTVFVKMDDDVLFLETQNFEHLIAPLAQFPNRIISANVINNAVCAKYEGWQERTANMFGLGDPRRAVNDQRWWSLHMNPAYARYAHREFLSSVASTLDYGDGYVRTRPGEAISINCIAFTHQTMRHLAAMMNDRLGDEGAVDRMLPWIAKSFHAAHLTFGPQEKEIGEAELSALRDEYAQLAKEYLA